MVPLITDCLCQNIICCEIQIRRVRSKTSHCSKTCTHESVHTLFPSPAVCALHWVNDDTAYFHLHLNHSMSHFSDSRVLWATARQPLCIHSVRTLFSSSSDAKWSNQSNSSPVGHFWVFHRVMTVHPSLLLLVQHSAVQGHRVECPRPSGWAPRSAPLTNALHSPLPSAHKHKMKGRVSKLFLTRFWSYLLKCSSRPDSHQWLKASEKKQRKRASVCGTSQDGLRLYQIISCVHPDRALTVHERTLHKQERHSPLMQRLKLVSESRTSRLQAVARWCASMCIAAVCNCDILSKCILLLLVFPYLALKNH